MLSELKKEVNTRGKDPFIYAGLLRKKKTPITVFFKAPFGFLRSKRTYIDHSFSRVYIQVEEETKEKHRE